jgi:hypothetical protein
MMCRAKIAMSMPGPIWIVSGAYSVQPAATAPPGTKKQRRGRQQPEAEVVHAGERHVRRADLQRDHPVREAHERRHDRAEHHDHAVRGHQLVVELGPEELQARLEQLQAQQQCQHAADQEHREAEPQVHRADVLVVGRVQPAPPPVRMIMRVVVVTDCGAWRAMRDCAHLGL